MGIVTEARPWQQRLEHLGIPDCTCRYEWRTIGRRGGMAWVRTTAIRGCPHHHKEVRPSQFAPHAGF